VESGLLRKFSKKKQKKKRQKSEKQQTISAQEHLQPVDVTHSLFVRPPPSPLSFFRRKLKKVKTKTKTKTRGSILFFRLLIFVSLKAETFFGVMGH
jgi:hypothetical protein